MISKTKERGDNDSFDILVVYISYIHIIRENQVCAEGLLRGKASRGFESATQIGPRPHRGNQTFTQQRVNRLHLQLSMAGRTHTALERYRSVTERVE